MPGSRFRAAAVVAVALGVAACGGSSSTPQATLHAYVSAWSKREYRAMAGQVHKPPANFAAINQAALARLDAPAPQLTAGTVSTSGSRASARVTERFTLPHVGTWTTATTVRMVDRSGHWLVSWTPATINPALGPGDGLALTRDWPQRAPILGAGGVKLTLDKPIVTVGIVGSRVNNGGQVRSDLQAAGASAGQIRQAFAQAKIHPGFFEPVFTVSKARYEQLKSAPGPSNVYAVRGTEFSLSSGRGALTQQLGAHVIGTVGPITAQQLQSLGAPYDASSQVGQTGIEQADERRLAGTPTTHVVVVDRTGATKTTLASYPGRAGQPVSTSIDPSVQRAAEAALSGVQHNAAMVALRASTGQVLSVVSDPVTSGYDLALQGAFPPGSTFKVITSTALFRAGLTPSSPATCVPNVTVNGEQFHNAEGDQPVQTIAQAFTESCNTAFISLATAHLKAADFTSAAALYGLQSTPHPGLPAFYANVPAPQSATALAATSIGQAQVTFSPLGMATVAAAIDSGGARAPRLVTGAPDDTVAPRPIPAGVRSDLQGMMADVVARGTAAGTGLPPATHAKTGTAQYYSGGKLHTDAWLMGYDGDLAFAVVVQDTGNMNGGPLDGPLIARFLRALGQG